MSWLTKLPAYGEWDSTGTGREEWAVADTADGEKGNGIKQQK